MVILRSHKKQALRTYYKKVRAELDPVEMSKMDEQIMVQFLKLGIQDSGFSYAMSYIPIRMTAEVSTEHINNYLFNHLQPPIQIAYPRTDFKTLEMEAVLPDAQTRYSQKWLRLTEPESGEILDPQKLDLVIMPLLAFDVKGNRVGYGKGFYDRYLAKCRPDVLKVGISYLPAVNQIEDVDQYDIPLDYCATPERLYEFS
jgi:5-formyltetrahydrofolate cyclo-ligase